MKLISLNTGLPREVTWKRELPGRELPVAVFGENFTAIGMTEDSVAG
jgi:hypothetical protein